jgi:hypothetical protein
MATLRDRLQVVDYPIVLALVLAPLFLLQWMPEQKATPRLLDLPVAKLRCLSGLCFLKRQENAVIELIPALQSRQAFLDDVAITLDEGSELELTFPDGGLLLLKATSLLRIQPGMGSLLQDLAKDTPGYDASEDMEKAGKPPASIIYVGNLPIEVLYPLPGTEIVARSFPMKLRMAFRVAARLKSESAVPKAEDDFLKWNLILDPQSTARNLGTLLFEQQGDENLYHVDLELKESGFYTLAPPGSSGSAGQGSVGFKVIDSASMADKINSLLEEVEKEGIGEVEIRQ